MASNVFQMPTNVQANWVQWALKAVTAQLEEYDKYDDYYRGDHKLGFATDKWIAAFGTKFEEFADNWCQVVVDSAVQRLDILGWECDNDKKAADRAEEIWDRNELDVQKGDLHTQAFVKGDAYMMVWEDTKDPEAAEIYYNDATEVAVYYDPRTNRRIERATKRYVDEKNQVHLWLYFPDRCEHYLVPQSTSPDQVAAFQAGFITSQDLPGGFVLEESIPNTYGEVPVFHFKNRSLGDTHGISEIKSVIPIQNAINKLLMDMMVGSEFGSFRQKWIAGGGQPKDGWRTGGDRVWATTDPMAKFGEFGQIDLEPIFKAVEVLVGHVAKITQTPMHYLRASGDVPSGEALKSAESGLVKKCLDRQRQWGASWSKMMTFALKLEGQEPKSPVFPVWKSPETRHDLEQAQTAQLKSILGIPLEQIWSELGYTEEQVGDFKKQNLAVAAAVLAQVLAQAGQLPPGTEQITNDPTALTQLLSGSVKNQATGDGNGGGNVDLTQILALLPKSVTAQTTAGEATTHPQPHSRPPGSPTRRSTGFKD